VGSSRGGLHVAETLRASLLDDAELTTWSEGEAAPSARAFDAAAFVLCSSPGFDVLLRLGLFLGVLGRERLVVCPAYDTVEIPAELRELSAPPQPAAIRELVLRVTQPGSAPRVPMPATPDLVSQVARRRRRSLGTASSDRPEQTLRIADISLTGALLETFGEIPENQVLDLDLALENGAHVRVTAEVVRMQYPQWGRVGGVGVRFVRFEGDSKAVLARYIEAEPERDAVTA